jgi:hypothetical protein
VAARFVLLHAKQFHRAVESNMGALDGCRKSGLVGLALPFGLLKEDRTDVNIALNGGRRLRHAEQAPQQWYARQIPFRPVIFGLSTFFLAGMPTTFRSNDLSLRLGLMHTKASSDLQSAN